MHSLVRSADDEEFGYSQLEAFLLYRSFSVGSEKERLQPCWPCPDDSLFENDILIVLEPIGPGESSNSSCP